MISDIDLYTGLCVSDYRLRSDTKFLGHREWIFKALSCCFLTFRKVRAVYIFLNETFIIFTSLLICKRKLMYLLRDDEIFLYLLDIYDK